MPKKLRQTLGERARRFVDDFSLPKQLAGQNVMAEAAKSTHSKTWRPRLEEADRVGTSVCPYCAVGCGQLIYAKNGKPIHIEGDPRSPINQGTLCPKGAGTLGMLLSPKRVSTVLYRAPHAKEPDGRLINQTIGLGSLGGATMDNEENYLIKKLFGGGLGMVNIENQARI